MLIPAMFRFDRVVRYRSTACRTASSDSAGRWLQAVKKSAMALAVANNKCTSFIVPSLYALFPAEKPWAPRPETSAESSDHRGFRRGTVQRQQEAHSIDFCSQTD